MNGFFLLSISHSWKHVYLYLKYQTKIIHFLSVSLLKQTSQCPFDKSYILYISYLSNMIVRLVGDAFETNDKGTIMSEQASDKPCSSAAGRDGTGEGEGS